jgi:hypothetical protein
VWKVIPDGKQAEAVDVKFGLIRRHIISVVVMYQKETKMKNTDCLHVTKVLDFIHEVLGSRLALSSAVFSAYLLYPSLQMKSKFVIVGTTKHV